MSKRLSHALHNEEACDFISTDDRFNDWVVTTAFYSAVHFVNHKMFPGEIPVNGSSTYCTEFADYYELVPQRLRQNIHRETINLVWQAIHNIGAEYERLFDLCHDARYKNYKVSKKHADLAKKLLCDIKAACHNTADADSPEK